MHYFQYIVQRDLANHALIFPRFVRKPQASGNFEKNSWLRRRSILHGLPFLACEKSGIFRRGFRYEIKNVFKHPCSNYIKMRVYEKHTLS